MRDAGRQEQPDEFRRLFRSSHLLLDTLVVVDRTVGSDELISQAVPHNRLASTIAKFREIRVIGSDYQPVLLDGLIPKPLVDGGWDRGPVKLGVLRNPVFQPIHGEGERLRL